MLAAIAQRARQSGQGGQSQLAPGDSLMSRPAGHRP